MSRKVPNQGRSQSVYKEFWEQQNSRKVLSASDLNEGQLKLLAELAVRQGGDAEDRCYTLFQFEPTETDKAIIRRRCEELAGEWEPEFRLIRRAT